VLFELVETVVLSISSEKVTVMLSAIDTELWLSAGDVEETVGAIPSITIALLEPIDPEAPAEDKVSVASLVALSLIVPLFA
jgi:hypothetical protein